MTITIDGFITTNVPIIEFFDNDLKQFYFMEKIFSHNNA